LMVTPLASSPSSLAISVLPLIRSPMAHLLVVCQFLFRHAIDLSMVFP
jgi:hypothetical protein